MNPDFDCWSLLGELRRRGTATTWELAEHFGKGRREIYGSLQYLLLKGFIQRTKKGHNGRHGMANYPAIWTATKGTK